MFTLVNCEVHFHVCVFCSTTNVLVWSLRKIFQARSKVGAKINIFPKLRDANCMSWCWYKLSLYEYLLMLFQYLLVLFQLNICLESNSGNMISTSCWGPVRLGTVLFLHLRSVYAKIIWFCEEWALTLALLKQPGASKPTTSSLCCFVS